MGADNFLIISDLQIPFEAEKALDFCRYLKRHFKVPDENIYCVGDETDNYFGGLWKKNPNASHSPIEELRESKEKLKMWYDAFPFVKVAISNHGTRWMRKAADAEIPSVMLREYKDVIKAPQGWQWRKHWKCLHSKHPFIVEHGDDHGGKFPHVQAAETNAMSTFIGHHHSVMGIEWIKTNGYEIFGCCAGSLIDFDQYAFEYARKAKRKPVIGCAVYSHGTPIIIKCD